jgi:broad specificity phosphatase PhoE
MRANITVLIHLLRHGETDRNLNGDLIGQSADEPLNQTGIEQSKKLAARLKKEGIVYDTIYTSPYKRAQETCKIVAAEMPKTTNLITVPAIREIDQGEGKDQSRSKLYADPAFREYTDFVGSAFHFEKGESLFDLEYRAASWLQKEITDNPFTRTDKALTIGIITHGMTVKCLLHSILNHDHRMTWRISADNASLTTLRLREGKWYLLSLNDTSHLIN